MKINLHDHVCKDERASEMQGSTVILTWAELLRAETAELLDLSDVVTLTPATVVSDPLAISECENPQATWHVTDS